jgi:hypothetical protein
MPIIFVQSPTTAWTNSVHDLTWTAMLWRGLSHIEKS